MKIILAFSLILLTATSSLLAQQELKRRPGTLYVLGPARTVRIEHATITNINGELVEGPRILVTTVAFSEDGTSAVRTIHHENGSLISRTAETYDPDGRLLELNYFDGGGVLKARSVNTYDTKKQLLERVSFRGDGSLSSRSVYRRQGDQVQIETIAYDFHGGVLASTTANVSVVGQPTAGEDLRERRIDTTSYNAQGVSRTQSSIASKPDGSQEYKLERSDGTWERAVTTPDGKRNSERISYKPDGSILSRERFASERDSYGNPVKMTKSAAKGDSQDFEPTEVTYWTVTYYEKN